MWPLIDGFLVKIYQLKGLQPKNKGHTNFYEFCDLTEKVYLAAFAAATDAGLYTVAFIIVAHCASTDGLGPV